MAPSIPVHVVDGAPGTQDDTFDSIPVSVVPTAYAVAADTGLYAPIASGNEDVVIPIPEGAKQVMLWFSISASDPSPTLGRILFNGSATSIAGITATDTKLWHHPPIVAQWVIPQNASHIHVAGQAGTVVRGGFTT